MSRKRRRREGNKYQEKEKEETRGHEMRSMEEARKGKLKGDEIKEDRWRRKEGEDE